ncbi:MAG TPA: glycosyltransferase family 9 protein [Holophagaceae bacterium]|nr:glycosyltransferase family 9 protein [Holophagaceae bacterium]
MSSVRPPKTSRFRHSQLAFRRGENGAISIEEWVIRMGDLVALMICAEQLKRVEGHRIAFQLMDEGHKALRADVLFKDTLDDILTTEGPGYGLEDPGAPELVDPGPLWIAATHHHGRHGGLVVPRLHFDPAVYQGPPLPEGPFVVFHPLFDPPYNKARGMDGTFVARLCRELERTCGDRLIVITDQPGRIPPGIRTVTSTRVYDLIYLLGHARVFIGGDTGFTHMAAAARVKHLFALYGEHYLQDFHTAFTRLVFKDAVLAFSAWGKYWGSGADTRPKCDPAETELHFQVLQGNGLPEAAVASLGREVAAFLASP